MSKPISISYKASSEPHTLQGYSCEKPLDLNQFARIPGMQKVAAFMHKNKDILRLTFTAKEYCTECTRSLNFGYEGRSGAEFESTDNPNVITFHSIGSPPYLGYQQLYNLIATAITEVYTGENDLKAKP